MLIITEEKLSNGRVNSDNGTTLGAVFRQGCEMYNLPYMPIHKGYCVGNGLTVLTLDDFFMTVEQFFKAGHQFVEGDQYLSPNDCVCWVSENFDGMNVDYANVESIDDNKRYVIFAECLTDLSSVL